MELNSNKSKHGSEFKKALLKELKKLFENGLLESVVTGKKFAFSNDHRVQFQAPFFLALGNKSIALFTTTTIRSDRLKITQWDSWGIKESYKGKIFSVLVLPNDLVGKEEKNFEIESNKLKNVKYISRIDALIQLNQLQEFLTEVKKQ